MGNQHDCWQSIIAELKRLCKELTFRSDFLGEFERDIVALASTYSVTEFVVYIGSTTKVNSLNIVFVKFITGINKFSLRMTS